MNANQASGRAAEPAQRPSPYQAGIFDRMVALVSGVDRAPGNAIAELYAGLGARVAVCAESADGLAACAERLRSAGAPEVLAHPVSISDPAQVETLMDAAWRHFGRIDVQVNAAATQFVHRALDCPLDQWQAVVDTNLNGTWYMMHAMARRWRDTGSAGNIINIVPAFQRGIPGAAHAGAAGAGVAHLSKTVAVEWAQYRIRVNCVAAGVIAGAGQPARTVESGATPDRTNPLRRAGAPRDIADAVAYLSAPSGDFITGEVLTVDGGGVLWGEAWPVAKPDYFKVTA
jgi:citronellol/citronellal dehydrogenase